MNTEIFHFSATGNSLQIARELASRLEDCASTPIPEALRAGRTASDAERVGIVFPVYAWGMPRIVTEFVERISASGSAYVFAVATCVAVPGGTLGHLDRALRKRGASLAAGFAVRAGRSSLMKLNTFDRIIIPLDRRRKRLRSGMERIDEIAACVESRRIHAPETSSWPANLFGSMVHKLALDSFRTIDARFAVQGSCKGCGTCAKVCPRANIAIESKRPVFGHDCEFCHACIQWCPNFAIRHPGFDENPVQYRNPTIQLGEIVARRSVEAGPA